MSKAESRLLFRNVIGISREFIKKYGNVPFVCRAKEIADQPEVTRMRFNAANYEKRKRKHGQKNLLAGM